MTPLAFNDYVAHDAMDLARLVRTRQTTPLELVETAIARLETVNPRINAVATALFDQARETAKTSLAGPFAGVPFAIKDLNHPVGGVRLTHGSRAFVDNASQTDSELVARYRTAGLVNLCTSTSCEFGLGVTTESALFGQTRNPWNLSLSAGGSSGGAAALVAAGVTPIAHATDGGGSIRIPAACCGLFGFKPSRGRTPVGARTDGWSGLTAAHAVTRSVRDSAALLDAVHGAPFGARLAEPSGGDFLTALGQDPPPLRIAVQTIGADGSPVDAECLAAIQTAIALCSDLGHHVDPVEPPLPDLSPHLLAVLAGHTAAALEARGAERGRAVADDEIETITRAFRDYGRQVAGIDLIKAEYAFMSAAVDMAKFHERYDILLTPVLGRPPAPLGVLSMMNAVEPFTAAMAGYSPFTSYQNITGQPAMSVPLHWSAQGTPIGVQFVAPFGCERRLFSLAAQLERAAPWFNRRPQL